MVDRFINPNKTENGDTFEGGFDTLKKYRKARKTMGPTWEYFNKSFTYIQNESNFRTKPVNEIDWENSIVVFGCSNVYGVGLAEEDTITAQLEKILSIPVINLGISGSAIDLASVNSLILHEHYPVPKAIVHLWTSASRYTDFTSGNIRKYIPTVESKQPRSKDYVSQLDWESRSKHYVLADNALWRGKTCYYQASMFQETFTLLDIDNLGTVDFARDLRHPGSESAKLTANIIASALIKLGVSK